MATAYERAAADSRGARQHLWENVPKIDWESTFPPPDAPVRMRAEDIATYKHPAVGAKAANKVLKHLRAQNTWLVDLTETTLLNWRGFLANRSDASNIIGAGVLTFLFIRVPGTTDPNWSYTPRADFALIRSDRSAVRLHPASTGDQPAPIFGKPGRGLLDWVQLPGDNPPPPPSQAADRHPTPTPPPPPPQPSRPAPPPEPVPSRPAARWEGVMTKQQCLSVPRVDCVSRRQAKEILRELAEDMAWQSLPTLELTDGTLFPWWRWLANLPDQAVDLIFGNHGISSFWATQDHDSTHYVAVQVDGTAFVLDILQERTSIKELDSHESPCCQEHPAAGYADAEQGEPVGHSSGGHGEPAADPSRSSSTGRSSPPTPAVHSDLMAEERVADTGSPRLDSHGGVVGHGVDSPTRPKESPMEHPVAPELPGGQPAPPPGLHCPSGNPRHLAPAQGPPQQESHQQQWQPQGGNRGASSEAPEIQTQVHQQPAHHNSAHWPVAQPDLEGHLSSHQTRHETERSDHRQQQGEAQPQQQRRWQENRWGERGWDDGHDNREGNGTNHSWWNARVWTHSNQDWSTGDW